jgi:hypothetical protein
MRSIDIVFLFFLFLLKTLFYHAYEKLTKINKHSKLMVYPIDMSDFTDENPVNDLYGKLDTFVIFRLIIERKQSKIRIIVRCISLNTNSNCKHSCRKLVLDTADHQYELILSCHFLFARLSALALLDSLRINRHA